MKKINQRTLEELLIWSTVDNVSFVIGNGRILEVIKKPTADQSTQG